MEALDAVIAALLALLTGGGGFVLVRNRRAALNGDAPATHDDVSQLKVEILRNRDKIVDIYEKFNDLAQRVVRVETLVESGRRNTRSL